MVQNLLNSLIKLVFAIIGIGLAVAIFLIGIVALWYFMLIGLVVWAVRSFYLAWKPRPNKSEVEIIIHEDQRSSSKPSRPGRVIEHE